MQNKAAWAVTGLGGVLLLFGATVMVLLGPDGRFVTGPHAVDTDGVAVVTAPGVVSWRGLQVDLLAELPVGKPVFVGVGNSVDVEDYLRDTARIEVTSFSTPWTVESREVDGDANLPSAPTALDWWIADQAGLGGAMISLPLPDETVSVAILSVGSANLAGLEVTFAYGVRGGFGQGASLAMFGAGLLWAGLLLRRGAGFADVVTLDAAGHHVIEEEVFVWVDEDGVEHEISADELDELGDVEVVDEPAEEER
ncbi:hypothetical protein [Aeromicrobium marinum]|uniref:hypothetical protein n=1 Tax=Aeromicrobium marinum TaxID=219314 RepID=UPI0001BCC96E|nr:hypothetical protein [Aeromicrobium marinum]